MISNTEEPAKNVHIFQLPNSISISVFLKMIVFQMALNMKKS